MHIQAYEERSSDFRQLARRRIDPFADKLSTWGNSLDLHIFYYASFSSFINAGATTIVFSLFKMACPGAPPLGLLTYFTKV